MTTPGTPFIERTDWQTLSESFAAFFNDLGDVTIEPDRLGFALPASGTGFELRRDGTSRSFMPLHGLELRWDAVRFDREHLEVTVQAEGARYVYRVPGTDVRR